jgi:hypothetical protein
MTCKKEKMTQSLINNGRSGHSADERFDATPKWVCGDEFRPRPENVSGANRVELARMKCDGTQMTVIYDSSEKMFVDAVNGQTYIPGAIEIKIVEIK